MQAFSHEQLVTSVRNDSTVTQPVVATTRVHPRLQNRPRVITRHRQTDRQAGRQADRQADRQAGRQRYRQRNREAGRQAGKQLGMQTGRHTPEKREGEGEVNEGMVRAWVQRWGGGSSGVANLLG